MPHLRFFFHPAFKSLKAILQKPESVIAKAMKQSHKSSRSVRRCNRLPQTQCWSGFTIRSHVHNVAHALNRHGTNL
ncbi:hypothetical protein B7R77_23240 [Ralstonia solanacearum K60]|uniref:Uncharacterized protein n=1 Tax=Ralstonia solanacearum K60 TaxID=1091042 RepID=A0AAP8D287_RALSL|nr:hypothetical protein B7R77_23240 [Ralstonia solanacearum K60]RIJ84177.1 hypothetical protein RSP822_22295 [Ralstonia solanacearum]